jgi:hypothetical protein
MQYMRINLTDFSFPQKTLHTEVGIFVVSLKTQIEPDQWRNNGETERNGVWFPEEGDSC